MNLRFVSWNIHNRQHIVPMIEVLRSIRADIIALQEVSASAYHELVDSSLFSWSAFSLDIRPPRNNEGRGRQLGCAVVGQAPFRLLGSSLLESTPLPERTLIVEVESPAGPLKVCSFHAPPGVSWGEKKPQSFLALAHWFTQHPSGVLVGMDANAPKRDHPDHQQNEWWWEEEECLLGSQPLHSLKDALRVWLAANPLEAESIRRVNPDGPLAVSYDRGQATSTPCRYDFIYSTTDFSVARVRYLYNEALKVGSDHALVVADLTLSKNGMSSATIPAFSIGE